MFATGIEIGRGTDAPGIANCSRILVLNPFPSKLIHSLLCYDTYLDSTHFLSMPINGDIASACNVLI